LQELFLLLKIQTLVTVIQWNVPKNLLWKKDVGGMCRRKGANTMRRFINEVTGSLNSASL